ncbi:MAG: hypothetical protein KDI78_13920, partial [Xanthomonadales bacterium]|nr:hypothetical protein [Xanthomonadales bacterium]
MADIKGTDHPSMEYRTQQREYQRKCQLDQRTGQWPKQLGKSRQCAHCSEQQSYTGKHTTMPIQSPKPIHDPSRA